MTEIKNEDLTLNKKENAPVFHHESGFMYQVKTQKEILNYLKQYVSGQESAVKHMSYILHLYSMKTFQYYSGVDSNSLPKVNTLITAPTGCGKTHLTKHSGGVDNLAYQRIDCSSFTAEGWKGTNLTTYLKEFLDKSPHGIGILHLDEFDKLAENGLSPGENTRQFTFERQASLLDLIDGSYSGIFESKTGQQYDLSNCNNALIIMSGSFQSMRQRNETIKAPIGFMGDVEENKVIVENWRKELKDFGFMPELANRIMSSVELDPYTREDVKNIIANTKNNAYEKFKNLIGDNRATLSDETIDKIIDQVVASENGMRELDALIFDEVFKNDSIF